MYVKWSFSEIEFFFSPNLQIKWNNSKWLRKKLNSRIRYESEMKSSTKIDSTCTWHCAQIDNYRSHCWKVEFRIHDLYMQCRLWFGIAHAHAASIKFCINMLKWILLQLYMSKHNFICFPYETRTRVAGVKIQYTNHLY
jgi:hypothetical protein